MPNSALPKLARPPANRPKAARDQISVQPWEGGLTDLARVNFPAVLWWHGYRKVDGVLGSYCYICNGFICTFTTAYPLSQPAREAIDKHKHQHRDGKRPTLAKLTVRGTAT